MALTMAQRRLTVVIDSDETECGFCFHMTCAAEKNGAAAQAWPPKMASRWCSEGAMTSTRTPVSICTCGKQLDAAAGRPGTSPSEGAISLCGYCGATWTFTKDLHLEPLDVNTLPAGPREHVLQVQARIRARRTS